jgi:hypothetical protein
MKVNLKSFNLKKMCMRRCLQVALMVTLIFAIFFVQYFSGAPKAYASSSFTRTQVSSALTTPMIQDYEQGEYKDTTGGYYDYHEGAPDEIIDDFVDEKPMTQSSTSCKWYQLGCHIKSIFSKFWDDIWEAVAGAVGKIVAWCFTFWMTLPLTGPLTTYMGLGSGSVYNPLSTVVTIPSPFDPNGVEFTIATFISWMKWFSFVSALIMLFVYFGRLAWARQSGQGFEVSKALFWIGIGLGITGGACALVPAMMTGNPAWRGPVGWITQQLWPMTALALVFGLIITGIKVITDQNGKPIKEFIQVIVMTLGVANLGGAVALLMSSIGDNLSMKIIQNSLLCSTTTQGWAAQSCVGTMIINTFTALGGPVGWLVLLIICLIGFISSLIQCMVMLARSMMLVFVLGGMTLAAAFRYTKIGKESFEKSVGWLVALFLYKPVVAIIYGIAFKFMGAADLGGVMTYSPGQTGAALRNALYFIVASILAIAALPALMKLITPAVSAMAEDGGGSALATLSSLGQTAMMAGRMAAGDPTAMAEAGAGGAAAIGGGAAGAGAGAGSISPAGGKPGDAGGGIPGVGGGGGQSGGGGDGGGIPGVGAAASMAEAGASSMNTDSSASSGGGGGGQGATGAGSGAGASSSPIPAGGGSQAAGGGQGASGAADAAKSALGAAGAAGA